MTSTKSRLGVGLRSILVLLFLSGCQSEFTRTQAMPSSLPDARSVQTFSGEGLTKPAGACNLPWGDGWISDGQKVLAYSRNEAQCAEGCPFVERECQNGVLGGNEEFKYAYCREVGCVGCQGIDGEQYAHQALVAVFRQNEVACEAECDAAPNRRMVDCNRGKWVDPANRSELAGVWIDFPHLACRKKECLCSLPGESQATIAAGTTRKFYDIAEGNCGACDQPVHFQERTCRSGQWSGDPAFIKTSCRKISCRDCVQPLNSAQKIPHGAELEFFRSAQGLSCEKVKRTCKDGVLGPPAEYQHPNCTVLFRSCTTPWGVSVQHGQGATGYKARAPECNEGCQSQSLWCKDGTWVTAAQGTTVGSWTGYSESSCTPKPTTACSCASPFQGSPVRVPIGQAGDPALTGYVEASPQCGGSCSTVQFRCVRETAAADPILKKEDGSPLTAGTLTQGCAVQTCQCSTPWGVPLPEGNTRTAYSASELGCTATQSCADLAKTFKCQRDGLGVLRLHVQSGSGWAPAESVSSFTALGCKKQSCLCSVPGSPIQLQDGSVDVEVFDREKGSTLEPCSALKLSCKQGVLTSSSHPDEPLIAEFTSKYRFPVCKQEIAGGDGGGEGGGEGDGFGRGRFKLGGASGGPGGPGFCKFVTGVSEPFCSGVCVLPGEHPVPPGIPPEFGMGGILMAGGVLTGFDVAQVEEGDSCQNHALTVYCPCGGGVAKLSRGTRYFPGCREAQP